MSSNKIIHGVGFTIYDVISRVSSYQFLGSRHSESIRRKENQSLFLQISISNILQDNIINSYHPLDEKNRPNPAGGWEVFAYVLLWIEIKIKIKTKIKVKNSYLTIFPTHPPDRLVPFANKL